MEFRAGKVLKNSFDFVSTIRLKTENAGGLQGAFIA